MDDDPPIRLFRNHREFLPEVNPVLIGPAWADSAKMGFYSIRRRFFACCQAESQERGKFAKKSAVDG